jgi:fatty-acyl-CoA synthase
VRWELDWLENRARITPHLQAVIDAETNKKWSYKQINDRAVSIAQWLSSQGVKKGDRIALIAPNHISYFDLLFASKKIGAIFVPLNWRLSINELNDVLADCSPVIVGIHVLFQDFFTQLSGPSTMKFIVGDGDYEWISFNTSEFRSEDIKIEDPVMMIYTGGTTGRPKGVVLTHQSIRWNAMNTVLSWNCPLEIYDAFAKKDLSFKEGYGLTEAGPNNFFIDSKEALLRRGSVGKPMLDQRKSLFFSLLE